MSAGSEPLELRKLGDQWVMTGDPYILHRASQAVPFGEKNANGSMVWKATEETAVELLWFKQRFPYHCRHEMVLRGDAAKCNLRLIEAKRVLAGNYSVNLSGFREGLAPREYQKQAAALWHANGDLLIADQIGVGKTISAIAGLADENHLPAVIVTPANIVYQWKSQLEKFVPSLSTHVIQGQKNYDLRVIAECENCGETATKKAAALRKCSYCGHKHFKTSYANVYMVSYNLAQHWVDRIGLVVKSAVFDECQEVRLDTSAKYRSCKKLSDSAKYRLGLSGTPVQNYGGEMYNVMNVVCPNRLGPKQLFKDTWCGYSDRQGREPPLKDPATFGKYLMGQGWMIRRTRQDIGRELPPEQRVIHQIDFDHDVFRKMTKDAKELARVVLKMADAQIKGADPFSAAGQFGAMMYKATGVAKAGPVAQFVRLLLESGEPVMLFGFHLDVYEIWARELATYKPVFITGKENSQKKEHSKQAFMAGETNLLICSVASGAGLDGIQDRCQIGVFGELDWSPAKIAQAVGRYHRDGQSKPCMTYIPLSQAGCDPFMMQTLGIKRLQVDGVVLQEDQDNVLDTVETANALRQLAAKFLEAA